jgi:hypothetical protein
MEKAYIGNKLPKKQITRILHQFKPMNEIKPQIIIQKPVQAVVQKSIVQVVVQKSIVQVVKPVQQYNPVQQHKQVQRQQPQYSPFQIKQVQKQQNKNTFMKKNVNSIYYQSDKYYYVCSYGGCGSWMLVQYLANFGNVFHIHSRNPPQKLTHVGCGNISEQGEWFNSIPIDENKLDNYKVIYLYKNPVKAIYSRFTNQIHLKNIGVKVNTQIKDVLNTRKDLYGIENFFDNYTQPASFFNKRNYQIVCVKYETCFDNMDKLNEALGLDNFPQLYPRKKETERKYHHYDQLCEIYKPLMDKMDSFDCVQIV